jgi:transposase
MQERRSEFAAVIGLDWADKKHDVCLSVPGREGLEREVIVHHPAALEAWVARLRERFAGAPVALVVELEEGPIVSALLEHEFIVVFPVKPGTVARYRKTFVPSNAKDDPTDAELMLELLLRHPEQLPRLERESDSMRQLRRLVAERRAFVEDRVRITNRITAALKAYYPQVLGWFRDKWTDVFIDFIERWPTLQDAQRARRETLVAFFQAHNVRQKAVIDGRIEALQSERPLSSDAGAIDPARFVVAQLLPQLRAVCAAIAQFDAKIAALAESMPDFELFASLPGAGPALAPRLLVAFGERRERFPDAAALQKYSGIAPVTERSGQKSWVHWRYACAKFLRQTFVEWTEQTLTRSFWARAFYDQQRDKGSTHNAAVRALAFKWIRILHRCWTDRTRYDETRYLNALRRRGSPVLAFAVQQAR